jgi:hypothetical protein
MGVSGYCLGWIRCFLSDRSQYVSIEGICSAKIAVTSGVPQGGVLSPTLFAGYVDSLTHRIFYSGIKLFADDAKMYLRTDIALNPALLQMDLNNVCNWAREWQLNLSISKCTVLCAARNPTQTMYSVNETQLTVSEQVKDLGVYISSNLKPSFHCQKIRVDALRVSSCIFRNFSVKQKDFLKQMFVTFVRPKLEYASVTWCPWLKKDINLIERVQRSFTYKIPDSNGSYPERLITLELESLELRRLYTDLTEVFKIFHGISDLDKTDLFKLSSSRTRGHNLKLLMQQSHCDERKYFFSNRIVGPWNSLSTETIQATSVNSFKRLLRQNSQLTNFLTGNSL